MITAASDYARCLLREDPLHEATYRTLMRLQALAGNRAGALRTYHTCTTRLQRALNVPPSPATEEAYRHLLNLKTSTMHTLPQPAPPGSPGKKLVRPAKMLATGDRPTADFFAISTREAATVCEIFQPIAQSVEMTYTWQLVEDVVTLWLEKTSF